MGIAAFERGAATAAVRRRVDGDLAAHEFEVDRDCPFGCPN
jgi:hypothetical protein